MADRTGARRRLPPAEESLMPPRRSGRVDSATDEAVLVEFGALDQRVRNVEQGQKALSERLDSFGQHVDRQFDKLTDNFASQVKSLSALFERRSQPQWQALSLIATISIAILMAFGGLASVLMTTQTGYVAERTTENRNGVITLTQLLRDNYVPRIELGQQSSFMQKEIDELGDRLEALRADTVTQDAHKALVDQVARLNGTVGNITPVGDVLKDMQDQIKRLQSQQTWYFLDGKPGPSRSPTGLPAN